MNANLTESLRAIQHMRTPLLRHPAESRVWLKCEGSGPYPAHKFRSFAFLAERALAEGVALRRICDRSSGSWAMAGAHIGSLVEAQTCWITAGNPPPVVRAYVEAHGGRFRRVERNEERIAWVEKLRAQGWWTPDQHNNPQVIDGFAETLGAQLERDLAALDAEIDYVVAPVGTGGMLAGVARRLRQTGRHLTAIGVDRASSVTNEYGRSWKPAAIKVRGVGSDDEVCTALRAARAEIDEVHPANEFDAARQMLEFTRMGPGCGLSGGLALHAAFEEVLSRCGRDDRVLVILPDSGLLYGGELRAAARMYGS